MLLFSERIEDAGMNEGEGQVGIRALGRGTAWFQPKGDPTPRDALGEHNHSRRRPPRAEADTGSG
jgi:hypothetical protein